MSEPDDRPGTGLRVAAALSRDVELVAAALSPGGPAAPAPLAALAAACASSDLIEEAIHLLVADARQAGHTWQEIGELLSVSRQAAQQRFGRPAERDPDAERLAGRATQLLGRLVDHDWSGASTDWGATMRAKLPPRRLAEAWEQIVASAGPLKRIGEPAIMRRGPYRVCEIPLEFEHGPLRAQVTFNHAGEVSGLFFRLPEPG